MVLEEERPLRREGENGLFESRPLYGKILALVKSQIGGLNFTMGADLTISVR